MGAISIFILEDQIVQAERLRRLVEEICSDQDVPYDFIEVTSKGERLLERIPRSAKVPIYFLDIEIKDSERKGLELAQEIRKLDSAGIIVFVTTHSELAPISYRYMVSAFTFIDKGLPFEEQARLIEQCLLYYKQRNECDAPADDFIVDTDHATIRMPFQQVDYIMTAEPHRLALSAGDRVVHFYGTLKEMEALDSRLLRCHQSYVVNTMLMASYDAVSREVIMRSGQRVPVSRRLARKVRAVLKGES